MKHYLFAKFFRQFSADALMEKCAELGIDGPTALIRDGYWVTDETLRESLPSFVRTAERHGLEVRYADTNIRMEDIAQEADRIAFLRENGITQFRLSYLVKAQFPGHPRELATIRQG